MRSASAASGRQLGSLAAGGQHAVGSFAHGPVQIFSLTLRLLRGEKRWENSDD